MSTGGSFVDRSSPAASPPSKRKPPTSKERAAQRREGNEGAESMSLTSGSEPEPEPEVEEEAEAEKEEEPESEPEVIPDKGTHSRPRASRKSGAQPQEQTKDKPRDSRPVVKRRPAKKSTPTTPVIPHRTVGSGSSLISTSRTEPEELEYDSPEREAGEEQGYYAIVWDTISNFYDETRLREGNWIFEGQLDQMNRYYAVEAYAKRL